MNLEFPYFYPFKDFADSDLWKEFLPGHIKRWSASYLFYGEYANITHIPIHIVYFENLKVDLEKEVRAIGNFYEKHFDFIPDDLETRMNCLLKENVKNNLKNYFFFEKF